MSLVLIDITGYKVFFYGGPNGNSGMAATISLEIVEDATVSLHFYPSGETIPANSQKFGYGNKVMYDAHFRYEQLANILDVLRNEKPVKFYFRQETLIAYITTATEPVGEGE